MPEQSSAIAVLNLALESRTDASRWYVAFSGGLDSTVLLHLVHTWCKSHPGAPELFAWHVNHGMQAAANDWEAQCASLCAEWGIPFQVARVSVEQRGKGAEAAARDARYRIFEDGLKEGDILLMAHHLDDQVETFFLHLMRGAGLQGMSGMPGERTLGEGLLLRPLLEVGRESLQAYARDRDLPYIQDPSNEDISLDRNFLRLKVLPALAERWAGYRQTVTRASGHVASALSTLEKYLPEPLTVYSTLGDPGLSMQVLTGGARDVAAIRLRSWLRSRALPMPGRAAVNEFLRQLDGAAEDASARLDCGGYVLQRYADAVYLLPEFRDEELKDGYTLAGGGSCEIAGVGVLSLIPASAEGIAVAGDEVLDIAWRRGGERCRPQGRAHSQTLKKLFQEEAVPTWWRERVPLLYLEDEMLAVGDLWFCESSRLRQPRETDQTLWQLRWKRNTFTPVD
jgi:tRNA(Ile)-lysidine synthase